MNRSDLTFQERETATSKVDLGPGYPIFSSCLRFYEKMRRGELTAAFGDREIDGGETRRKLHESTRLCLTIGEGAEIFVESTFSGSIAIQRTIIATCNLIRERYRSRTVQFFCTSPCIDIIPRMCAEVSRDSLSVISLASKNYDIDAAHFLTEQISERMKQNATKHFILIISSPENPTGNVWPEEALECLLRFCERHSSFLLVDHCFFGVGLRPEIVRPIWEVGVESDAWLGVWDTGKHLAFAGEKVGFIIGPNRGEVQHAVVEALSVVQYDISEQRKTLFASVFRSDEYQRIKAELSKLCGENLDYLDRSLNQFSVDVSRPMAGSLALLNLDSLGLQSSVVRSELAERGLGVVEGRVFFHAGEKIGCLVRLALARDRKYFRWGVDRLYEYLERRFEN